MSQNPYEPPKDTSPESGSILRSHAELRKIAWYQKAMLVSIITWMIAAFGEALIPPQMSTLLDPFLAIVALVIAVLAFLLALKLYGIALGLLFGVLAVVPALGILVILGIHLKANDILRGNGVQVGLFGVSLSELFSK